MRLRVIKKIGDKYDKELKCFVPCDEFEPQWFDEEKRRWCECRLDDTLSVKHYYTVEKAIEVCNEFLAMSPDGNVVWTNEKTD